MTHDAATAYACVAYRVMEYDREPLTEEQFEVVLEMLFGFYNEREIEKIYQQNIVFGSNDAIINEEKIKGKIEKYCWKAAILFIETNDVFWKKLSCKHR